MVFPHEKSPDAEHVAPIAIRMIEVLADERLLTIHERNESSYRVSVPPELRKAVVETFGRYIEPNSTGHTVASAAVLPHP